MLGVVGVFANAYTREQEKNHLFQNKGLSPPPMGTYKSQDIPNIPNAITSFPMTVYLYFYNILIIR
jgi:hypothetical protein